MSDLPEFPDAKDAWITFLEQKFRPLRVTDAIVDDRSFIRIGRIGGPQHDKFSDFPMVSVDVYAPDRQAAMQLAGKVRSTIGNARGKRLSDTVACKRITETSGPYDNPDEGHASERVSWSFQSRLRAVTT